MAGRGGYWRLALVPLVTLLVAGCASPPPKGDGPPRGDMDFSRVPDAVPRVEPPSRYGNPPSYVVFGTRYYPLKSSQGYRERGVASWYGTKFHGLHTSSREPYDMYGMTAAHKTLPLPTYARVTNLENGRSIIVRVNDRGPFHANRIIDLSYVGAGKLGILGKGTGLVEVTALQPGQPDPDPRLVARESSGATAPRLTSPQPPAAPARLAVVPAASPQAATPAANIPATTLAGSDARPPPPTPIGPVAPQPRLFLQLGAFSSRQNAERLRERVTGQLDANVRIQAAGRQEAPVYRVCIGPLASVEGADVLAERLQGLGMGPPRIVIE